MPNAISVPRAGSLPVPKPGETWERRRADSVAAPRTVTRVATGEDGTQLVSFSMPIDDEIREITLQQWHRWVHVHQAILAPTEPFPPASAGGPGGAGSDALLIIDVQPTFMPGGELPVPEGYAVVPLINELLDGAFACVVATQDWHPRGHVSFASVHPGRQPFEIIDLPYGAQTLWPDHALQGSHGAALHPALKQDRIDLILRKGVRPQLDSYSAFTENDHTTSTGLAGYLRERGIDRVFLCGLALDFCVAWSASDAVAAGFQTVVIEDACRGIGAPDGDVTTIVTARGKLESLGVAFTSAKEAISMLAAPILQAP